MILCMTPIPALLTASEVAARAGVSAETVRRWVREGNLAAIELPSGRLRFSPADVDALLSPSKATA